MSHFETLSDADLLETTYVSVESGELTVSAAGRALTLSAGQEAVVMADQPPRLLTVDPTPTPAPSPTSTTQPETTVTPAPGGVSDEDDDDDAGNGADDERDDDIDDEGVDDDDEAAMADGDRSATSGNVYLARCGSRDSGRV